MVFTKVISPFRGPVFRKNVDDLLHNMFDSHGFDSSCCTTFDSGIDIEERDDSYVMSANLPGVNEEDIEITIENNRLKLSVEQKNAGSDENKRYILRERRDVKLQRSFPLASNVDAENVEAQFDNGVLEVVVQKKEEDKPKKIELKKKN